MSPLLAAALVLTALFVWGVFLWNRLVRSRNDVRNAWSQIDVQLARRHDLVPNLVEAVKGYARHEADLLREVAEARRRAVRLAARGADAAGELGEAETTLGIAISRLLGIAEAYPELKASRNFLALQEELASTENRIAFARQAYNDAVARYMTLRESFPDRLLAGGFEPYPYFTMKDEAARRPPDVTLDDLAGRSAV